MDEDIKTLLETGRKMNGPHLVEVTEGQIPVVINESGEPVILSIDQAEKWMGKPTHIRGRFVFADADSFVRYFNEHKNNLSRIFAKLTDVEASFEGKLNFHGEGEADWGDHVCIFALQPTKEWGTWLANNRKEMNQEQFALFLEDNLDLFKEPAGADLLELIKTLEAKSNANIVSAIKLNSGQLNVTLDEQIEVRGGSTVNKETTMEIPTMLKVSISPFQGVPFYDMAARLRHRIRERKIVFWYETVSPHLVVRKIGSDQLLEIEKKTKVVPFKV